VIDDHMALEERRGLERRVEMLERDMRELVSKAAVLDALIQGLISTMDSRHKAFERGQDLILERLGRFVSPDIIHAKHQELMAIEARVTLIEAAKSKFAGALWFALTIIGMAGGIVTLVKAIKGP